MNRPDPDHQSTRSIGIAMTVGAWIVGLGLVTLLFQGMLTHQDNPNQDLAVSLDDGREVVLKRNRMGHYVAPGAINGQPVEFLLDTGATTVSIPGHLARELGLRRGRPMRANTAAGQVTSYATRLDSVQLGGITQRDVWASINPSMDLNEVLLGMSFLKRLELTQRGDTLTLRAPEG